MTLCSPDATVIWLSMDYRALIPSRDRGSFLSLLHPEWLRWKSIQPLTSFDRMELAIE